MIDIKEEDLKYVLNTIHKYVPDCEVRVFGSRFKGKAKPYSDLDIALVADKKVDWLLLEKIKDDFAESDLPFRVDLLDWYTISESFKEVIINKGYEVLG